MPYGDWLKITDGTEQDGRFQAALSDGYFNVDEMKFADLLAMGADLAARLNFFNLRGEKDGNWAELFTSDETVIMAMILSRDLKRLETGFLRFYAGSHDNLSLAQRLVRFAGMIDFWYRKLEVGNLTARTLSWHIAAIVESRLAVDLHSLGACCRRLRGGDDPRDTALFAGFHDMWRVGREGERLVFRRERTDGIESGEATRRFLHATFYSFLNAVSFLQKTAAASIEETSASGSHNPAMALYMAFLSLYRRAQERINTFQARHLDFYYRQMLHLSPRVPAADSTFLLFEADMAGGEFIIPRGTGFSAGKDASKRERVFQADNDLVVTDARVQALRTLLFKRDRLISPERELNFVTGVHARHIPLPAPGEAGPDGLAWPLFGAVKRGAEQGEGAGAALGFALATPVLLLREGKRTVEIAVYFTRQSTSADAVKKAAAALFSDLATEEECFRRFGELIPPYLLAGRDHLTETEKHEILSKVHGRISASSHRLISGMLLGDRQDLFYTLIPGIFSLELTGPKGWYEVHGVAVERAAARGRTARDGLKFSFTLGPEAEPVVPYSPELHGEGYGTKLPLVRFRLNGQASFCACSLFDFVELSEFLVAVRVSGVTDLLAYNNHGRLDPTQPFNPFGPVPTGNSFLIVGNYEAALKKLTELRLNIQWGELPREEGGFREYYRGYDKTYANDVFTADVSLLRDGTWLPGPGVAAGRTSLFESVEGGGDIIACDRAISVGVLNYHKPQESSLSEEMYRFDLRVRGGFFRFALAGPDGAFGHREYPGLLTKVLTTNTKLKPRHQLPIPNPPYTPLINRITLDYEASDIVRVEPAAAAAMDDFRAKPFHIHPFGIETMQPLGFHYLLPHYQYDGNLFIGFTTSRPGGVLTLFFHLREDSGGAAAAAPPEIAWFYLVSDRWVRLEKGRILSDTTDAFLTSGIVTLQIPEGINRENSVMPREYYWLRVSATNELDSFCSVVAVRAQALKASRRMDGGDKEPAARKIPPGTICEALQTIPGIARIHQPLESSGGRCREEPSRLKTRASERLRHKNRVTLPWDYERLVLERFPEVFKAKCFSVMDSGREELPRPGRVMVVVVPRVKECDRGLVFDPMLNSVELSRIRAYLLRHSSPFVHVEVRNPVYERIQVRCRVALTKGAEARTGHCLAMLNQAIVDYISPWCGIGCKVRFGWTIRRADVEAYIRSLDYVDFVTKFSMLHITEDGKGKYALGDTARGGRIGAAETADDVRPRYPWSLAIPFARHHIEIVSSLRSAEAESTGINDLQVGNTFIIGA